MSESTLTIDSLGTKIWKSNNGLHREDGPAIEFKNGTKMWFFNGVRHRIDGPASEYSNGDKEWFINGKRYKEDSLMVQLLKEKACRKEQ
jgi:hypothetical protein